MKTHLLMGVLLVLLISGCETREPALPPSKPIVIQTDFTVRRSPHDTAAEKEKAATEFQILVLEKSKMGFRTRPIDGLPMFFEKNVGQSNDRFKYLARRPDYGIYFTDKSIVAAFLNRDLIHSKEIPGISTSAGTKEIEAGFSMSLVNAEAVPPKPEALRNAFIHVVEGTGSDEMHQIPQVPQLLRYESVYRGVDLLLFGKGSQLHYAFQVAPDASAKDIRWRFDGASKLTIDRKGNLVVWLGERKVVQTAPVAFERQPSGKFKKFSARYRLVDRKTVGFVISGSRTSGSTLFIDPVLAFATYFGGSGDEGTVDADLGAFEIIHRGFDIAAGQDGRLYVVGTTTSADLEVTQDGALQGSSDAFVVAFEVASDSPGVSYATYIGGSASERGRGIAPAADGRVYVCGHSSSTNFPVSADVLHPARDECGGYLLRLAPNGAFERGTYVGASCTYHPNAVKYEASNSVDDVPRVYITGAVLDEDMPEASLATDGAFQTEHAGTFDAFVGAYRPDLDELSYFTFVGGAGRDSAMDIAVRDGYAFITGATSSADFPTTEIAAQTTHASDPESKSICAPNATLWGSGECYDAFITRINREGSSLLYSTFYGFSDEDFARGIGLDDSSRAFITGATKNRQSGITTEVFVAKLEAGGASILGESFVQGLDSDHGAAVAVDSQGRAHVVGTIRADGLATTGIDVIQSSLGGASDMFYWRVSPDGAETEYFTYYGGEALDRGFAVDAVNISDDGDVCAFLAGATASEGLATDNAISGQLAGGASDLLVAILCDIILPPDIQKVASTNVAPPGTVFSYTIVLINGGDQPWTGVTVEDPVPDELELVAVFPPASCSLQGNLVSCPLLTLPAMSSTSITITVRMKEDLACDQTITNTATASTLGFSDSASDLGVSTGDCMEPPSTPPVTPIPICGDGAIDPGEECDDANTDDNDACSNSCRCQTPLGSSCGSGACPCVEGASCSQTCGWYEECAISLPGLCIGGSGPSELCTPATCM